MKRMITHVMRRSARLSTSPISPGALSRISMRPSSLKAHPPTASLKSVRVRNMADMGLGYLCASEGDTAYHNLSYGELANHHGAHAGGEGVFANNGAFVVDTGKFTGRSPKDKYIVKQSPSDEHIWWGEINAAMSPETFDYLYDRAIEYYKTQVSDVFVLDGFCGAHEGSRRNVRFVTEKSWHSHFVKNMFIRPSDEDLEGFVPDFTVINCYGMNDDKWKEHGLNSDTFVAFNVEKRVAIIGGAWYGGEMKKGIFSMMHYWLPQEHTLSMHCSANIGKQNDVCIFFGLSGTGKTTLSTDPDRRLIGDDEHGWDDEGIFNFEGGCYAKTSKLLREKEPEIYDAIKFGALMENVWIDPSSREPDYFNESMTENGRVSYPIEHILNREETLSGGHPSYIVFLCCDAFGVLPPVAKLSPAQAMYHFVSGYTAKVAGTERGIVEPEATFSPCYGSAFLTLHPLSYASLMKQKLEEHKVDCYLVNSGWSGGGYATGGERMSIKTTRACLNAIFDGSIKKARFKKDEAFMFDVPTSLPGVDPKVLDPRSSWPDKKAYDVAHDKLRGLFAKNIVQYAKDGDLSTYEGAGPV